MKIRIIVMLLAALIMGAALADMQVYKWVDKNGNVHYSTVPPDQNAQVLNIVNSAGQASSASSAPSATSSVERALTTTSPEDSPACKSAKEALGKYLDASYLFTLSKDGKKEQLSAKDQGKAIAQAKSAVTQACSPKEPQP